MFKSIIIVLTLVIACATFGYFHFYQDSTLPVLILNMPNEATLPKKFRTVKDPFSLNHNLKPTRLGLDSLNLSGSGQFSELSLRSVIEKTSLPTQFYLVDLREESHGYINGNGVSWYGVKDWANIGKDVTQIDREENHLFTKILEKKRVEIGNLLLKDETGKKVPKVQNVLTEVHSAFTEKTLSDQLHIQYSRFPITDHVKPSDEILDQIIIFMRDLPENSWIHCHCSAGVGRTTTFMALVDIIKNAKRVSLKDILDRQWLIGGRDLRRLSPGTWKEKYIAERIVMLNHFYDYCRTNQDNYQTLWTNYLDSHNLEHKNLE